MKFVNYTHNQRTQTGVLTDQGILPLSILQPYLTGRNKPLCMPELMEEVGLSSELERVIQSKYEELLPSVLREEEITYLPSVLHPGKIICIGLNYRRHAAEVNAPESALPVVFSKFSDAVAAHKEPVPIPKTTSKLDYEGELAVVIGRKAENVSQEEALDYVFGYCAANDVSARDLQMQTGQWLLGKTSPGFAPLGPCLVTSDEVGDPNDLGIRTCVNGIEVQNSNTSDMIFSCAYLVHYLSQHFTLNPGDVIMTGTPEGVILGKPEHEQHWLQPGDIVSVTIEKLGTLENTIV